MDDLISRQSAIDSIGKCTDIYVNNLPTMIDKAEAYKALNELPSAQPEPHWIPCSERLPEDDELMLVNYIEQREGAVDIWIGWHEMENVWYIDGNAHSREFGNEVIAWMPLPEPPKMEVEQE